MVFLIASTYLCRYDQMLHVVRYSSVFKIRRRDASGVLRTLQRLGAGSPHAALIETATGIPVAVSKVLFESGTT
jgi:hypothetical protein